MRTNAVITTQQGWEDVPQAVAGRWRCRYRGGWLDNDAGRLLRAAVIQAADVHVSIS